MNIPELIESQRKLFQSEKTLSLSFRLAKLGQLREMIKDNHELLCNALDQDFNKPLFEAYGGEIATLLHEIDLHHRNLRHWAKPYKARGALMTIPSGNKIYYQPYGNVLIFGAWNYPILLILQPLIGALSAGNTAILKPSELAPATSRTLAELIKKYFDPAYLAVVEGGAETGRELLSRKFDYIFFTGSRRVGKIVMKAAAEHLTPVTLELGGKSPAIVHKDADLETSARRIWWGKCLNGGQTCVAPDYTIVHKDIEKEFIGYSKKILESFYDNSDAGATPSTRIINREHFDRLKTLLSGTEPLLGGKNDREARFIEPTLVKADWGHKLMEEEIFGPILPLLTFDNLPELIKRLQNLPASLALYLFTSSTDVKNSFIRSVPFGGGCINDTISQYLNSNLPFGGIGSSGMGSYHGRYSYETFSHKKSILDKPIWPDPDFRYPPYTNIKINLVKKIFS